MPFKRRKILNFLTVYFGALMFNISFWYQNIQADTVRSFSPLQLGVSPVTSVRVIVYKVKMVTYENAKCDWRVKVMEL